MEWWGEVKQVIPGIHWFSRILDNRFNNKKIIIIMNFISFKWFQYTSFVAEIPIMWYICVLLGNSNVYLNAFQDYLAGWSTSEHHWIHFTSILAGNFYLDRSSIGNHNYWQSLFIFTMSTVGSECQNTDVPDVPHTKTIPAKSCFTSGAQLEAWPGVRGEQ